MAKSLDTECFVVAMVLTGNEDGSHGRTETAVFANDTPLYDALVWAARAKGVDVKDLKDAVVISVGQQL